MSLPKFIAARHIAIALGPEWSSQRVTRILKRMGIAKYILGARGVFVTPEDLAGAWPEQYENMLEVMHKIKAVPEKPRRGKTVTKVTTSGESGKGGHDTCTPDTDTNENES